MQILASFVVRGVELAIVKRADLAKLRGVELPPSKTEALGARLRAARKFAGLTQAELADRLGSAQAHVSNAEAGRARIGNGYVGRVLAACGLPEGWEPKAPKRTTSTTKRTK